MKKLRLLPLLLAMLLLLSACSVKNPVFSVDHNAKADATFREIISAIRDKDVQKLVALFSSNVQTEADLMENANRLIDYVQGDITVFSAASDSGVGVDASTEKGKKVAEMQSAFTVETDESKYYIAIRECFVNEENVNGIGVQSIYIIKATDWTKDSIYRGDGKWTPGINIGDT